MEPSQPTQIADEPRGLGTGPTLSDRRAELEQAQRLASRYNVEFVDMDRFPIDQDLFRTIPADLMLRYGFVPYRREGKALVIVVPDPTDLPMIDELSVLLGMPVTVTGTPSSTASSSIIGRSVGSGTTITSALPSRR